MVDTIQNINQKKGSLTEGQLQVAVACKWLKIGIPSLNGGETLAKYLEDNQNDIENIFGADDRIYIRTKNPDANKALAEFIIENKIGDDIQWIKCKDADRWWLEIWWD